ncbi:phage tail assembly chaperone [Pseudomonas citronellolis]|uniref:phage tail assembly chaperone n=1 Tax=Pseudomonas citronellolis TaxID=53408 RepID=UPI0023E41973|nr:phage tail assembly chaperone [Pseudomonas citronellolis]MDF3932308.1 phage tail assembly chaperone [Pseudomonas citronellolis]
MNAPTIYNTHPITREYLSTGLADPDPLLRDTETFKPIEGDMSGGAGWLIPAHAFIDAPPDAEPGKAIQRLEDGSAWVLVADHRGTVYMTSNGHAVTWSQLGDLPVEFTDLAPGTSFDIWADGWKTDTTAQLVAQASSARGERDAELEESQWLVERHRDQVSAGTVTNLSAEQFSELLVYRQALRDWPVASGFPAEASKPVAPDWLAAATLI